MTAAAPLDLDGPPPEVADGSSRRKEILDMAEALVEAEGLDALTLRRLAETLGIRAPSLYKHLRDKAELEAALQERALLSMGAALRDAPNSPDSGGAARALGRAYRAWASAHGGMYALATGRPLARERLTPGVELWSAWPVMKVTGGDQDRARALWAGAHGLVTLELADRFPPGADVEAAWDILTDSLLPRTAAHQQSRAPEPSAGVLDPGDQTPPG